MPPLETTDNPFLQPEFNELPKPAVGGCWVRLPNNSLEPDPSEPPPPSLAVEGNPE